MLSHHRIDENNSADITPTRLGNQPILDNRYVLLNTVGQGRYAEVKVALDTRNHLRKVAIKLIKPEQTNTITKLNITRQQMLLLSDCQYCPNVIQLLASNADGVIRNSAGDCILRENALDFLSHIQDQYLNKSLMMQNLLIDKFGVVKIADFGWAARLEGEYDMRNDDNNDNGGGDGQQRQKEQQRKGNQDFHSKKFGEFQATFPVGTQEYNAPELLQSYERGHGCYNGEKIDIFSLGVCLFMLLHASPPFRQASVCDPYYKKFLNDNKSSYWRIYRGIQTSTEFKDLAQKMLDPSPRKRITLKEIFKHPWLQKGEKVNYQELRQQLTNRIGQIQKKNDVKHISTTTTTLAPPMIHPIQQSDQNLIFQSKEHEQLKMLRDRMVEEFRANNYRLRQMRKEMKSRDLSSSSSIFGKDPQYEYEASNSSEGGSVENSTPPNQQGNECQRKELQDPVLQISQSSKQSSSSPNKQSIPDSLIQIFEQDNTTSQITNNNQQLQLPDLQNFLYFEQDPTTAAGSDNLLNKRNSDHESNKSQQDQLSQKSIKKNPQNTRNIISDQFNMNLKDMMSSPHRQSVSDSQRYNQQLEGALKYFDQQKKDNQLITKEQIPLTLKRSISRAYGQR